MHWSWVHLTFLDRETPALSLHAQLHAVHINRANYLQYLSSSRRCRDWRTVTTNDIRVIKDSIDINPLAYSTKIDFLRKGMAIALWTNKLLLETPTLTTSINPRSLLIRSPKSNTKWHRKTAFSPRNVRLIVSRSIDLLSSF